MGRWSRPDRSLSSPSIGTSSPTPTCSSAGTSRVARAPAREEPTGAAEGLERRNLSAAAEQRAARAATPSTRRPYAAIYRSFGDWLRASSAARDRAPPHAAGLLGHFA